MFELYLYCLGILETKGELPLDKFVIELKNQFQFEATEQEVVTALQDIKAGKVIPIENVFRCKPVCKHTGSAQDKS